MSKPMTFIERLAHRPQTLWLRRALFQVHLWTGLAVSLYVLVICLSGSAIVLRREMNHFFCPRIVRVAPIGPRLSDAQLAEAARQTPRGRLLDPGARIQVRGSLVPGAAVEVWYLARGIRVERLLDPYTGKDLGDTVACEPLLVTRLAGLHDDLLGGRTGRTVNGFGALVVLLMAATGALLWWPGTSRWRRSLTLRWHVPTRRFIWDLHSAVGFWMLVPVLLWGVSGVYLGFPGAVSDLEDALSAHGAAPVLLESIDNFTEELARLHFGRAYGLAAKWLWVILGLAPVALLVTGALMWWARVIRRPASRAPAT